MKSGFGAPILAKLQVLDAKTVVRFIEVRYQIDRALQAFDGFPEATF